MPEAREVVVGEVRPYRVWTLYGQDGWRDPNVRPQLPITPIHNQGAFLEDYVHDWNFRVVGGKGILKYYSRVVEHSVWVLVEYTKGDTA